MGYYYGDTPIKSMSLTQSWGINPATAELVCVGTARPTLDEEMWLTLGGTTWFGCIKGSQVKTGADGVTTSIRLVDNRDTLMQSCVFGQFNMQDANGRMYHVFPGADWIYQRKSYAFPLGIGPVFVMTYILSGTGFGVVASSDSVYNLLVNASYIIPNLDWNQGKKRGAALLEICDLLGLHFAIGDNPQALFVGRKGESVEYLSGNFFEHAEGTERVFADNRVTVIGDPNIYELTDVPLYSDWPSAWNPYVWDQAALLKELRSINPSNPWAVKVSQCDPAYHDSRTYAGHPRNDMLVGDYVECIPFKIYKLNLSSSVSLNGHSSLLSDLMPLCDRLVSDTDAQVKVKATGYKFDPRSPLQPLTLVDEDTSSGYEVDSAAGKIIFHERRFKDSGTMLSTVGAQKKVVNTGITADTPLLTFAVQREFFQATYGVGSRSGSHHVRNLRKEYICTSGGSVTQVVDRGSIPAEMYAQYVASLITNRPTVVTNGYAKRAGQCGYQLSDRFDRITVSLDANEGIIEHVTYTNEEPQLGIPSEREMDRRVKAVMPKTDLAKANEVWDAVSAAIAQARPATANAPKSGGGGASNQITGETSTDVTVMDPAGIITAKNY